jgi:uncharacterized protein YhdP
LHLIFRPLLILLTISALVIASLQVGGRVLFWLLDDLEIAANQWLWAQGIRIEGLQGDWHRLNPVVRIDRIDLPAGWVEDVYVEVGLLESLWRGTPIAQRFSLREGEIDIEHTESGWRFRGGMGSFDLELGDLLYHSDEILLSSRLRFFSAAGTSAIDADYQAINRTGMHRHRLKLRNDPPQCEGDCSLRIAFDASDAVALVGSASRVVSASSNGFTVPEAIVQRGSLQIADLDLNWHQYEETAGGIAAISVHGLELSPGRPISSGMVIQTRGLAAGHVAEIRNGYLSQADTRIELPTFWLELEEGIASWWTPELDLGATLGFLGEQLPAGSAGSRWLTGLQVRGQARNLRGYVDTGSGDLGYGATLNRIFLESFGGAPYMRGGGGELVGHRRGMQIKLNAENMDTHWRGQFEDNWMMTYAQGILQAFFGDGYFAMRGLGMRLAVDDSHASGGFALNRVVGVPEEDRLTLIVNVDQSSVQDVKRFVPIRLPVGLPEWIEDGPRSGVLEDIAFAYHGQIIVAPFELARRLEMSANIVDGHVRYHPDWPEVLELDGFLEVAGRDVRLDVQRGVSSYGSVIDGTRVLLGDNASYADVVLSTETTAEAALTFIRTTPLIDWMNFISPTWAGAGTLTLDGTLHIPLILRADHIGETAFEDEFTAQVDIGLKETDLDLGDYRITLNKLTGLVTYAYPYDVRASSVRGELFGKAATLGARNDADTVIFSIAGQAAYTDVLDLVEMSDPGIMQGGFDFLADLHVELADEISRLEVVSDLTGLALDLPGEFGKQPEHAVSTDVVLRFLDDYEALNFGYGSARGWLHIDDEPLRGAIGFGQAPPVIDATSQELVLSGQIEGFGLEEVIPDSADESGVAIPIRLDDLIAGYVGLEELRFDDVALNGHIAPEELSIVFESAALRGEVGYVGDDPLQVHLTQLLLPATDSTEDPLDPSVIEELPRANVVLDQFSVGEDDYGAWSFDLVPDENGVALDNLTANLRGVAVSAEKVYWSRADNQTRFKGTLNFGDLADVLPMWDIAPGLETESAELSGDLYWHGSPGNVDIDRLIGPTSFVAKDGRFLDVDASGQGALKFFSLVNFSTVLKRMNLDFSDLRGEGVTFEQITAEAYFNEGFVSFTPEPMEIVGSGSEFKIAGQVNLIDGTLDNEMIVTLPVTRSLPWYAAYIALASPITAIGVLVGERVLRKPIEQFSSAKYTITGPIDDPELTFVNVWDRSVDEPQTVLEEPPAELPVDPDLVDSPPQEEDS